MILLTILVNLWQNTLPSLPNSSDATGVGVGLLLAAKAAEIVWPMVKKMNSNGQAERSGDKNPDYWKRYFNDELGKASGEQLRLLGEIRDDIRELVVLERDK